MLVKPLPEKLQKKGKRIAACVATFLGLVFAGALGTFIGLTVSVKQDTIITPEVSSAKTLKDTGSGFVYSTEDKHLVFSDYKQENKVVSDVNEELRKDPTIESLGNLNSVTSLSYLPNSHKLMVSAEFKVEESVSNYLFEFTQDNSSKFVYNVDSKYIKTIGAVTAFTEHGDNFFAIIRDSRKATITKFNLLDLTLPTETAYLFEKSVNYETQTKGTISYNFAYDHVIYNLNYKEDTNTVFIISNYGVFGIKDGTFNNYPASLDAKDFKLDDEKTTYSNYVYYYYSNSKLEPRGAVIIDGVGYLVTKSQTMAKIDFDTFDSSLPQMDQSNEVNEKLISDISFNEAAPDNRNGLFYNKDAKKAAVITKLGNTITLVNMENPSKPVIEFTDYSEIEITDVVITSGGEYVYYLCQNTEITKNNSRMLKVKDVSQVYKNIQFGKFTPGLLTTTIIAALLFLVALFCAIQPMFLEKFLGFLKNLKRNWVAYFFLSISLVLLGMFCYYPAVGSISMSFFNYKTNEPVVWNNFSNYATLFTSGEIWQSFGYMLLFLVTDVITAIIPPLIFAFFLTVIRNKKISGIARTLLFLPSVIPGITKMLIWQTGIYGEYGIINRIVQLFNGNPVVFFSGTNFDPWALILMGFPYVGSYLVFYGALMNVPGSYYEAAELEGLGVWKRFVGIDIPLIKPQIKYVVILTVIASVQNFGRTYMITSSLFTIRTPIHIMYDYINTGNYGLSSAIATILFALLLVFTIFNFRKQKEQLGDSI